MGQVQGAYSGQQQSEIATNVRSLPLCLRILLGSKVKMVIIVISHGNP